MLSKRIVSLMRQAQPLPRTLTIAVMLLILILLRSISFGPNDTPLSAHENLALHDPSDVDIQDEPESWELSKIYDPAWMRHHLMVSERLPHPITVPAIRGQVFDPDGRAIEGVSVFSHTPRHWIRMNVSGRIGDSHGSPSTTTRSDGRFGLPERTEPYRVLVACDLGVASLSHEELIQAEGNITLEPWARLEGTARLHGKPIAGESVRIYMNTVPWSYSPGGPRLTLEYSTTTDEDGHYSFERVPPLSGRVHVMTEGSLGHGVRFTCHPGETTEADIGSGIKASGWLVSPLNPEIDWTRLQAIVSHRWPDLPVPEEVAVLEDEGAIERWREEWEQTAEGQAYYDELQQLANLNYPGYVDEMGQLIIHGLPSGSFHVTVYTLDDAISESFQFEIPEGTEQQYRIGELNLTPSDELTTNFGSTEWLEVDADLEDDMCGVLVDDENEFRLPDLQVRVIDKAGEPIVGATVLLYDRNNFRARQPVDFEQVDGETDDSGKVNLGKLPQTYFCVQVNAHSGYNTTYAVLTRNVEDGFCHTIPDRPLIRLEEDDERLNVTFTVRHSVDLAFAPIDRDTSEPVFFGQIYYFDPTDDRWWMLTLHDSGGQHLFTPIIEELADYPLIAIAPGYEPVEFRLDERLELGRAFEQEVLMSKAAKIVINIEKPDGTPASGAVLRPTYPTGLAGVSGREQHIANENGRVEFESPAQGRYVTYQISHESGSAEFSLADLPEATEIDDRGTIQEVSKTTVSLIQE